MCIEDFLLRAPYSFACTNICCCMPWDFSGSIHLIICIICMIRLSLTKTICLSYSQEGKVQQEPVCISYLLKIIFGGICISVYEHIKKIIVGTFFILKLYCVITVLCRRIFRSQSIDSIVLDSLPSLYPSARSSVRFQGTLRFRGLLSVIRSCVNLLVPFSDCTKALHKDKCTRFFSRKSFNQTEHTKCITDNI